MSRHHGRAAIRVTLPVFALLLVLGALLYGGQLWRKQALPGQPMLPIIFEHSDHPDIQCIDCHHNWVDDTGSGTCLYCHKTDPAVSFDIEPMFHEFCWSCHIEERHKDNESGPLRACSLCHTDH